MWPGSGWPNDLWLWKCDHGAAGPTICGSGNVAHGYLGMPRSLGNGSVSRPATFDRGAAGRTICGSGNVTTARLAERFVALEMWPGRGWPNDLWLWKCGQGAAGPMICGSGNMARARLAQRFVALEMWPGRGWPNDLWPNADSSGNVARAR